jgi:hypothetical protein
MPEKFKYTTEIECADIDGIAIHEGSVLTSTEPTDKCRGVVTAIRREGDHCRMAELVGDLIIETFPGVTRVTNKYKKWRHVPRDDQTYQERLLSWKYLPYDHEEDREASEDEGLAIDGIMALLPADIVDWENGPWPDRLDDALGFLVEHLAELKGE